MRHDEVMNATLNTQAADWVSIEGIYRNGHHGRAVLRDDVDIALVWGREHNDGEPWSHESWSHSFPDRSVRGFYVEVLYRGQVVHADLLLGVDGHRATLPSGTITTGGGVRVTRAEAALAELVDELQGHHEFGRYMKQAGFEVEPAGPGPSVPRRIR